MKGGKGCAVAYLWRYGFHILPGHLLKPVQIVKEPLPALFENGGPGSILHALNETVNFLCLDAVQVISHGHVELEALRTAQSKFPGQHLAGKPGLYILVKCLGHIELCGPLAVIALVVSLDTRFGYGKVLAVQLLYGLKLEETAACHVGSHDILGQLGMGSCCGSEGSLQLTAKNLIGFVRVCNEWSLDAKYSALLVLFKDPVHQFSKWNRGHNVAHIILILLYNQTRSQHRIPGTLSPGPPSGSAARETLSSRGAAFPPPCNRISLINYTLRMRCLYIGKTSHPWKAFPTDAGCCPGN